MYRLYGEMRTGTNYLAVLLRKHYKIYLYWFNKHEPFDGVDYKGTIITVKNPYSWMWSMLNCNLVTEKTLFKGIATFNKHLDYTLQGNLIRRYNDFYNSLFEIPEERRIFVKFEDLLENPEEVLNNINSKIIKQSEKIKFINEEQIVRSEERIMNKPFTRKEFYLEEQYLKELSDGTKYMIAKNLDLELAKKLRYVE